MGDIVEVDVRQLRVVADRVMAAAEKLAEMRWPTAGPDGLPGSSVGRVAGPASVAARLSDVVATMRGWAVAAHLSADAFERSERDSGERIASQ